jgi:small conductance mechanosensitive channel
LALQEAERVQDSKSPSATGPAGGATGVSGPAGHTGTTGGELDFSIEGLTAKTEEVAKNTGTLARKWVPPTIGVIVILVVAWFLSSWARRGARRAMDRAHFDATLGKFLSNIVRWLILTLAVITCMNLFGIESTSFAAVLGAAGLAVGLALQGSLSNLAAGIMLLIFRPFKIGDSIVAAGQTGKVNEIDLFQTTIDTPDGRRIIVPNGPIFGGVIENSTFHSTRRVDIPVTVATDAAMDQTRAALQAAVKRVAGILPESPIDISPTGFPVAGVDWIVSVWARTQDLGAVKVALVNAIKDELDRAEISLKK